MTKDVHWSKRPFTEDDDYSGHTRYIVLSDRNCIVGRLTKAEGVILSVPDGYTMIPVYLVVESEWDWFMKLPVFNMRCADETD